MTNRPTISAEYLEENSSSNPNCGVASLSFVPIVADFIRQIEVQSVSDYGADKKVIN